MMNIRLILWGFVAGSAALCVELMLSERLFAQSPTDRTTHINEIRSDIKAKFRVQEALDQQIVQVDKRVADLEQQKANAKPALVFYMTSKSAKLEPTKPDCKPSEKRSSKTPASY